MAEFTMARVHADLESVRLSDIYRNSPLLEGAPVPRFRLPELTLDVPVAIKGVTEITGASGRTYQPPSAKRLPQLIKKAVEDAALDLDAKQQSSLSDAAAAQFKEHWAQPLGLPAALGSAHLIASGTTQKLQGLKWPLLGSDGKELPAMEAEAQRNRAVIDFRRSLENQLHRLVAGSLADGPRVEVLARTADLREVSDSSMIVRMHLTLREDAFEIVKIDRADGSREERLVPE